MGVTLQAIEHFREQVLAAAASNTALRLRGGGTKDWYGQELQGEILDTRLDVIGDAPVGVLDDDLRVAALKALEVSRAACREYALRFSWEASTDQFLQYLPRISR